MNTGIQSVEALTAALREAKEELDLARNETKEALARQTATAAILKVIAGSPTDVQPVLNAIAASAMGLVGGFSAVVTRVDGDNILLDALTTTSEAGDDAVRSFFPRSLSTSFGPHAMAIRSRAPYSIADTETGPKVSREISALARERGYRSSLAVPMLRGGEAIGAINVARRDPGPFSHHHISLLNTFADQAVIAIENVRLFNETKEALERQTATAGILRAISNSPSDIRPVFETLVEAAARFCGAPDVVIFSLDGNMLHGRAACGNFAEILVRQAGGVQALGIPVDRASVSGRAVAECRLIHVHDLAAEPEDEYPAARDLQRRFGHRSMVSAPLLRQGVPLGAIALFRAEVKPFSDRQLALLQIFADQAVIAIENVRLFNETKEALERQTATAEILSVISNTPTDTQPVFDAIATSALRIFGGMDVGVGLVDGNEIEIRASTLDHAERGVVRRIPLNRDSAVGQTLLDCRVINIGDIEAPDTPPLTRERGRATGWRSVANAPMLRDGVAIGYLSVHRAEPVPLDSKHLALLKTFADQAVIAIENVRLFNEIKEKSRQLEEASQHKSNFLASMSHELRTPLNAILGFNEMILDEIYGPVAPDVRSPLEEMQASGKHLLRLINNVLDLAKIEAGRMELSLQDYSVHDTVGSVHSTLRSIAAEKGLEFLATVPNDVPLAHGDGGRIAQCLMNLAGNSLKFTKVGKVEISVETRGELLIYKVTDTGIGIPPDKIDSLFTEFKQTDATIASEYGGTGLGLSISKKFIEMHGGRIWIESELGKGSAFIFEVPLRAKAI